MFDFLNFKKQVNSVKEQAENLDKAIVDKRRELEHLRTAPPQKADVIHYFCGPDGVIDRLAGNYNEALSYTIAPLLRRPLSFEVVRDVAVIATQPGPNMSASPRSIEAAFLFLFRDEAKTAFQKAIEGMVWPKDVGPSIAERPALIKAVESELAALAASQENLRRQLAEAGIII